MKSMKSILDSHPDFELNINNKPVSLMKSTHNNMHETVIAHYTLFLMTDSLNRLRNVQKLKLNLYWIMCKYLNKMVKLRKPT